MPNRATANGNDRRRRGSLRRGFTLFSFVMVLIVASALGGVSLDRYFYYQEQMEKLLVEITVRKLRSELRLRVADLMMQDRMGENAVLIEQNPMSWLSPLPPNYLGELRNVRPKEVEPGNWYFDTDRRELVYVPRNTRSLRLEGASEEAIRLRLTHTTEAQLVGSRPTARVEGLALVFVNPYVWD